MVNMSPDTVCLKNQIKSLVDDKKWKDIIGIGKQISHDEKCRYIWVWPDENFFYFIKKICLDEIQIKTILSIGCGSGLLEWLIQESTGIHVYGVEIDKKWWNSKHSPMKFIQLNYVDDKDITFEFLKNCIPKNEKKENEEFILLFCYFNCYEIFRKYLNAFNGKYIMIIGPDTRQTQMESSKNYKVFTEPGPFDLEETNDNENIWKLYKYFKIDNNNNYMTLYRRE